MSSQTPVVREEGGAPTHFVSNILFLREVGIYRDKSLFFPSDLVIVIGRGQFGGVYRALSWNIGQMVAAKRIELEGLKKEEIAQLMQEVNLIKGW